jgi:hypothetical protein
MMNKEIRLVALAFFLLAITLRILPLWYNVAPMAALALFAGCYLSGRVGLVLAFGAMAASDCLGHWLEIPSMGFYSRSTMLTVYLALGLTAGIGTMLRGRVNALSVPLASLAGTAVFFLATNFACWLDPMMGYAPDLSGLANCYVQALPFARNTLVGDLFYSAVLFGVYNLLVAPRWELQTAKA